MSTNWSSFAIRRGSAGCILKELEEASRFYVCDENVQGMLDVLLPLHAKINRGPETGREVDFIHSFCRDLAEARVYVEEYVRLLTQK